MGNHEWCEECQSSSFHYGKPCDPVKVARVKAARDEHARLEARANEAAVKLVESLRGLGLEAQFDSWNPQHVTISKWTLVDAPAGKANARRS
jgi:hypothetical protein